MPLLLLLGVLAGSLTTVAGLGGGQLLVLALATVLGPRAGLAVSAPALLCGNLHRFLLYRRDADRRIALAFASGAVPGSVVGGWVAVGLPSWLLSSLIAATTLLAVARAAGLLRIDPPRSALPVAGAFIGLVCATSSGAGLLLAPLLLSTGLAGSAYIATGALCAAALHLGRIAGYAAGGSFDGRTLAVSTALAAAIIAGNLLGERVRRHLPRRAEPWIEHGTLIACIGLSVAQLL